MKFPQPLSLILATTLSLTAAEPTQKPHTPDDSHTHVLKSSDFFTLAQELGDTSIAGENEAARLMAAAKRIQTETRVASKSMRRVMILGEWRAALKHWEDLQLQLVLFWSGGGSMFTQMMSGNDFTTEVLLGGIADHLPLVEKPLSKETSQKIDGLLKKAKDRLAQGKTAAKKRGDESRMRYEKLAQQLEEAHAALKYQFQYASDDATTQLLLDRCMEPTELWE